jgi:hypothetical protein
MIRSISLVGEQDHWLVKEIVQLSKGPVKSRLLPSCFNLFYIYYKMKSNSLRVGGFRSLLVSKIKEKHYKTQMNKWNEIR